MPYHIEPKIIIDGTLYTLLAFSVATWTVILFKSWEFANNSYRNRRFTAAFWDASHLAQAELLPADAAIGPQARIAKQGFAWLNESRNSEGKHLKYCGSPAELLEQSLLVQMQKEQHHDGKRLDPARQYRQHCAVRRPVRHGAGHHACDA